MSKILKGEKLFVIKKYIMAKSAHEALKKERRVRPDDVWVDEDFRKQNPNNLESCIGFHVEQDYTNYSEESKNEHKRKTR